ncbi:MAG TPA: BTAD domain-containing putative transcriptional regulator [Solirubrobacteraceae bacterium]|jgi:DNA-binding SARP family transcriptional activator|nr:BTAD domain-containing putative transcriptional regulator [Solirubrobacteraceae bacterium]
MSAAVAEALEREAFAGFPYAMLVLQADGTVVCANAQARRLIGDEQAGLAELTCCEVFGCGAAGSPLAGSCVARLGLRVDDGGAVELQVEMSTPSGGVPVWLAAGRLGPERVAVQIRPSRVAVGGQARNVHSPPGLHLRCLGTTQVESGGRGIGGSWLDQRAGQLLKFLVAHRRRPVTVDEIAEGIWADASYQAAGNVRYYVHALRGHLEPGRGRREASVFIRSQAGTYQLDSEWVTLDIDTFEKQAARALDAGGVDPIRALELAEGALAAYRGGFLEELPYADWANGERQHLHELACRTLRMVADERLERGDLGEAGRALNRLGELEPYDEDVQRELIELELRSGRRSRAVRRYSALAARSRRMFGEGPSFELSDLSQPLR